MINIHENTTEQNPARLRQTSTLDPQDAEDLQASTDGIYSREKVHEGRGF